MPIRTTGHQDIDHATSEIAVALRDADPGKRDQHYYDEAMRLRDAIMRGTRDQARRSSYRTPVWLHERVNDPYGTPNNHEFWGTVVVTRLGVYKMFTRGGWAYAYDTQHNAWLHFATEAERAQHCAKPAIDPWA
jgi:hypothetical protein